MKQVFFDLETTGTWTNKHGITEISMIVVNEDGSQDSFFRTVRPIDGSEIDLEALRVTNKTVEEINGYDSPGIVYKALTDFLGEYVDKFDKLDKMILYGYNVKFDEGFLRNWFKKLGDPFFGSWFFAPSIDVMSLAAEKLKGERTSLRDFQLSTVAQYLNIKVDKEKLHGSFYDTQLTYEVYKEVTK